jgi:uncharacterized protein
MSLTLHAWYGLRDLEALGVRQAEFRGELLLQQLARFAGLLRSAGGSVKATLRFRQRGSGWVEATLQYETAVELTCQRCLEPMTEHLAATVELALLESGALASRVPEGTEPVVLEGDRLNLAELIEDELIVGLPLVPKHGRIEDCGSLARLIAEPAAAPDAPEL